MLIEQVIYDVKTGKTRIEQIEVEDVVEETQPSQPTIEERVTKLEEVYTKLLSTFNIEI